MPTLLLIAMKRSGTNHFMDLVGRLPLCLCAREMFNPEGVFGLGARKGVVAKAVQQTLDKTDLDERDPDLIAYAQNSPLELMQLSERAAKDAGYPWFGVTVFDNQVANSTLEALLARPSTLIVVLKRKSLPRAISLKKARLAGAWKRLDTTDIKPRIDLKEVQKEHQAAVAWYSSVHKMVSDCKNPVVDLTYEDDVRPGPETLLTALASSAPAFPWAKGDNVPSSSFNIQDQLEEVFERVQNGTELRTAAENDPSAADLFGYP